MAAREVAFDEFKTLVGQELGQSEWHEVTQDEVNAFAECTHDHQWIHCDPERAKAESPFGGPIAHGYYTLSHIPYFMAEIIDVTGVKMGVEKTLTFGPDEMKRLKEIVLENRSQARHGGHYTRELGVAERYIADAAGGWL